MGLLKLKVWQALGDLEPQRMEIFHEGTLLDNDEATISTYGVKAMAVLHVRPSGPGGRRGRGGGGGGSDDEGIDGKTLESYLGYWGSERPSGGAVRERGFEDSIFSRSSAPATSAIDIEKVAAAPASPIAVDSDVDEASPSKKARKDDDRGFWTCPNCTINNDLTSTHCLACDTHCELVVESQGA